MNSTPSIAELIRTHAMRSSDTVALLHLIRRHHPQATLQEIVIELRRQAEADLTEADHLEAYARARSRQA
jgi:hypothetical protein